MSGQTGWFRASLRDSHRVRSSSAFDRDRWSCCAGLMIILVIIWVMDLPAMAFITAAITLERFAPVGERLARADGGVVLGAGLFLIARATGLE